MFTRSQATIDTQALFEVERLAAKLAKHDMALLKSICDDLAELKQILEPTPHHEVALNLSYVVGIDSNNIKIKSLLD